MNKSEIPGNGNLSIHTFNDPDFRRLIELANTTYAGREIANTEYLNWEYKLNVDGPALTTVAESGNEIVSQYVVLPRIFLINGRKVKGSLSVNTLTHPFFRRRGLFDQLARETFVMCLSKEILFTIGFPNSISHPIIKKKQIFETVGFLPLIMIPLNFFQPILRYFISKKEKTGAEIEMKIPKELTGESQLVSLFNFDLDASRYNDFISKVISEKDNLTLRSLDFLRWRYQTIPKRKYYLFKLMEGDEIHAIAVFRSRYIFGMRCGILVDFITHSKAINAENILLQIKKLGKGNNLDIILSTAPVASIEFNKMKKAGGFVLSWKLLPQKLAFIIQKHTASCPPQVSDFQKWFLTFGDYDIF